MILDLELEKVASGPSLAKETETETSASISHSETAGTSGTASITCRC